MAAYFPFEYGNMYRIVLKYCLNTKALLTVLLVTVSACTRAGGWHLQPLVTVYSGYNFAGREIFDHSGGAFTIYHPLNFGVSAVNRFYLRQSWYLVAGIRLQGFNTNVNARDRMYNRSVVPVMSWKQNSYFFSIPIWVGKGFVFKGHKWDVYGGVSFGMMKENMKLHYVGRSYAIDGDSVAVSGKNYGDPALMKGAVVLDFGGDFQPFLNARRFRMGFLLSWPLAATDIHRYYSRQTFYQNGVLLGDYGSEISFRQHFFNAGLSVTYLFGGKI